MATKCRASAMVSSNASIGVGFFTAGDTLGFAVALAMARLLLDPDRCGTERASTREGYI